MNIFVLGGGETSFAIFASSLLQVLGGNVILSVGHAYGSSGSQSGLNLKVSGDFQKKKHFCLLSLRFPWIYHFFPFCPSSRVFDSFSPHHISVLTLTAVFNCSWLLLSVSALSTPFLSALCLYLTFVCLLFILPFIHVFCHQCLQQVYHVKPPPMLWMDSCLFHCFCDLI